MAAVLMLVMLMLPVSAEDAAPTYMLSDFNTTTEGWYAGDNVKETAAADFAADPDEPELTRSCLSVISYNLDVNLIRSVCKDFSAPVNLKEYRTFRYDLFVIPYEDDPEAEYLTRVTLRSMNGDTFESFDTVRAGEWCTVKADIGGWAGRTELVSAEISVVIGTSIRQFRPNSFFIDAVMAADPVDREMSGRYLFDDYTVEGATATQAGDKSMITIAALTGDPATLKAEVFLPDMEFPANCLRIRMSNYTTAETLTIHYSTYDTAVQSEDKSVTIKLTPQTGPQFYYADVGDVSSLRRLELRFGEGTGRFELYSISAISRYHEEEQITCGTLTGCTLGDDLATVTFSGEILRDEALRNSSGQIRIYALNDNEIPTADALGSMTPVVTSPMTTRFDLTCKLPQTGFAELSRMYLAVSYRTDGSFSLIAPPFQLENPERAAGLDNAFPRGAKGFAPTDLSLAGDSGAGVTVLRLDAASAFVSKSEGKRYIYNGEAYYFSERYFDSLTAQLYALRDGDTAVLLRLCGITGSFQTNLADALAADGYVDYSGIGSEPDGADFVGALSGYIAERWIADGSVVGVILGEYNNLLTEDTPTLTAVVEQAADQLRRIHTNIISKNSAAKVYLSVSDLWRTEPATGNVELELSEFVPALLAETGKNGQFGWHLCIDRIYRFQKLGDHCIDETDLDALTAILPAEKQLLICDNRYQFLNLKYSEITAWYVQGYLAAWFNPRIDAYIAVTSPDTDKLFGSVKVMGTESDEGIISMALTTLGLEDWRGIIPNFDMNALPQAEVTLYEAVTEPPEGIRGSFAYYKFDNFMGVGALRPSFHCGTLSVAEDGGSVLSAPLGAETSGAWMGIAHRFDFPENYSLTPVLEITLKLEDTLPSTLKDVPVKLVLMGKNERFESETRIPAGEWTTIYVYTGEFGECRDTECIQLLAGGSELMGATMKVRSIKGLSREYNDESLESVIADERIKKQTEGDRSGISPFLWIGAAAIVGVATVITVALLSRGKEKKSDE